MWNARQITKAGQICDQMGCELVLSVVDGSERKRRREGQECCSHAAVQELRLSPHTGWLRLKSAAVLVGSSDRVKCSRACCQAWTICCFRSLPVLTLLILYSSQYSSPQRISGPLQRYGHSSPPPTFKSHESWLAAHPTNAL